jgi:predicted transcriptional regulator
MASLGIKIAIASLDRGEGIPHDQVKRWVLSWDSDNELPIPESAVARGQAQEYPK